jgi:tRNA pseudouridine38-40 synthase
VPFFKATIAYKGSGYQGWQSQPNGLTVQDCLNKAIAAVSKSEDVKTIGSGRTDAGVHARGQIVRIETPLVIKPTNFLMALNTKLPTDIRVVDCEETSDEFHPIFSAKSKWYSYFFTLSDYPDPLLHELLSSLSFEVDTSLMAQACSRFVGRHDFVNFYTEGTEVKSTIRTIHSCELIQHDKLSTPFPFYSPVFEIRIHGEGFLKQMVRMMVGAIWTCGRGKLAPSDISEALKETKIQRLGPVAPPNGLYLMQVVYPSN